MASIRYIIFSALLMFGQVSLADQRAAKLYERDKNREKVHFTQKTNTEKLANGDTRSKTEVFNEKGELVMSEDTVFNGVMLRTQAADVMKEHYEVLVKNGRVFFRGGKKSEESEELTSDFTTGPLLDEFLRAHWDELLKGDTVHCRFAVPDMHETFGFKFWVLSKDKNIVKIAMKPSSVFVAMAVATMELEFDVNQKKRIKYSGRTPLQLKVGDKMKPFDAEIVYE